MSCLAKMDICMIGFPAEAEVKEAS